MDSYGFAEPGKEFPKPQLEDFADADGYVDYYEFDMALDQWQSQFPNLRESWCGDPREQVTVIEIDNTDWLINLLAA